MLDDYPSWVAYYWQDLLNRLGGAGVNYVATRAALKALDTDYASAAFLTEGNRAGPFAWDATVPALTHQADTQEGIYVAPRPTQAGAWVRQFDGIYTPEFFGADGTGADAVLDTLAVQAMWDALPAKARIKFTRRYLLNPIDASCDYKTIDATGAEFTLASPGVLFNFNPQADPHNISGTTKSFGNWCGGTFLSTGGVDAVGYIAMKIYGVRQMAVRDAVFGDFVTRGQWSSAIQVAFLGAHEFQNNRFLTPGIAFDCPDASDGEPGPFNIAITTSTWIDNQFILSSTVGQKAFYVNGGWRDWKIIGGFVNGSPTDVCHFTNNIRAQRLLIQGMGFEQPVANSSFVYIEDVGGSAMSNLTIDQVPMEGNPAGGGFVGLKLERVQRTVLKSFHTDAQVATGNAAVTMDANCSYLEVDNGCRFVDPSLTPSAALVIDAAVDREELIFPSRDLDGPLMLTGYNGDSFSTGGITLDMSTLITGDRYPTYGVPPRGYQLLVQARDSGSAGAPTGRRVELARTAADLAQRRNMLELSGVANDERRAMNCYQPAHTDGSIFVDIFASGADTLDLWIWVLAIRN